MSDVVKRDLYGLIDKELEAANQKFPLFNSTHEAFAVILEEAEEAKEEAGNLDILMNNFWIGVKENHDPEVLHEELTGIYKTALDLAVEEGKKGRHAAPKEIIKSLRHWGSRTGRLRSFNRKQVRPHETRRQLYFDRGNTGENKRNQGKEGVGLKTGQKLPPFPFIIFIKERW